MKRAIILAAGKGSRMASDLPKVCQKIHGVTFLFRLMDTLERAGVDEIYPIVGYDKETVIKEHQLTKYFVQEELTGTATAVKAARAQLEYKHGLTLVLAGDIPMVKKETLLSLMKKHEEEQNALTFVTIRRKFRGYGHILRDEFGNVMGQVEDHDATEEEKKIEELNTSVYCFDNRLLFAHIDEITNNNSKKEFYINDMMEIFYKHQLPIGTLELDEVEEVMGVNDLETLKHLEDLTK